jgi:hypothetical protein
VPAIADLLTCANRERLDALVRPLSVQALAEAARDAASTSHGHGRFAWLSVAVALSNAASADDARERLGQMLKDSPVRPLALACLSSLCTPQPPETP